MTITIREPGSAITHLIAMLLTAMAAAPLLLLASLTRNTAALTSMFVFVLSMLMLYGASTVYHSVTVPASILKVFKKLDHMMIFVLIAGSYTPVCLLVLKGVAGYALLAVIWGIAIVGILFKALWVTCPKWVSSIIYISMGWACVFVFGTLYRMLSAYAFAWLLAGGIIYTIGGVIYALKLPVFNSKHTIFGSHVIFHLFVMAGSLCHFVFMFGLLLGR